QSTAGKTTTADIATSLYGKPDEQRLTWYGTALGIANEALAHNDGLLSLDEVGKARTLSMSTRQLIPCLMARGRYRGQKKAVTALWQAGEPWRSVPERKISPRS
ncbi:DUF927 domain-containing protein, partial [Xenorhabdus bovienii]|uniref:DUF927 domain-containing protein n=1 Tax=Xenorhabdus bovienii TaxID=40576 RepID=UPI0023B27B84